MITQFDLERGHFFSGGGGGGGVLFFGGVGGGGGVGKLVVGVA